MAEDNVELLKIALKDDASVSEVTHNSNTDTFVKRATINNNLTSIDKANGLHKNDIIGDAWEEDVAVQHDHQGSQSDNKAKKRDREMRAKHQKLMLWRVVHNFLSATSFHGLPMIASTKSFFCGLTFWMIPMLLGLGLMLWALISVTKQYREMNTVLFSKLLFNNKLLFPAVTICNKNYFRKSVAEMTNITLNELVEFLHVVSGNPYLVNDFDFDSFFHKHGHLFANETSVFYFRYSGHQLEQMVYSCTYAGENCLHSFTQRSSSYGNCYTFNSGINASVLYSNKRGHRYGLELLLNVEQYEYFLAESVSVGFDVFIHDQTHFPYYENIDGFSITPGQETQVALRRLDYKLLPSGDGGQCRNDVDLEYFNGYSYASCIVECFTDFIVGTCGCKFEYLPGPAKVCILTDKCQYNTSRLFSETEQCNCPIACDFTVYERRLSYSKSPANHFAELLRNSDVFLSESHYDFPDFVISTIEYENGTEVQYLNENFNRSFLTDNTLKLLVYYDTLTSTTMVEGLEYSLFQFIADFGGHIGLFTGAGFLTIFEIIQLCCGLVRPAYGLGYTLY